MSCSIGSSCCPPTLQSTRASGSAQNKPQAYTSSASQSASNQAEVNPGDILKALLAQVLGGQSDS